MNEQNGQNGQNRQGRLNNMHSGTGSNTNNGLNTNTNPMPKAAGGEIDSDGARLNERKIRSSAYSDRLLSYSPRLEHPTGVSSRKGQVSEFRGAGRSEQKNISAPRKKTAARKTSAYKPYKRKKSAAHIAGKPAAYKKSVAKQVYYGSSDALNPPKPARKRKRKKCVLSRLYIKTGNSCSSKANPEQKNKERKREQIIGGLKRTFMIFCLLLLVSAGIYGIYRLTLVKEIIITGSEKYNSNRIKDCCNIQPGHNIFSYKTNDIEEKLNTVPELTLVSIKRHFPDRLEIIVTDSVPKAAIPLGNGTYTLIDSEGIVISIGRPDAEGLIRIKGLTSTSFKCGNCISCRENPNLRSAAALELLRSVGAFGFLEAVTCIDVSNISCVKLVLKNDFTAVLGVYPEALGNIETAKKAYDILLAPYPNGGIINVFSGLTTVDFTPYTAETPEIMNMPGASDLPVTTESAEASNPSDPGSTPVLGSTPVPGNMSNPESIPDPAETDSAAVSPVPLP